MATGMVFVIVTRNIDLSASARCSAMCSAVMAMTAGPLAARRLGLGLGHPLIAPVTILAGLVVGTAIGAFHGWLIGYQGIPSFIVTLGGLLVWRNVAWYIDRRPDRRRRSTRRILLLRRRRGDARRRPGRWVVGRAARGRRRLGDLVGPRAPRRAHGFPVKPAWAEAAARRWSSSARSSASSPSSTPTRSPRPSCAAIFEARGETMPEGYTVGHGLPISVLILIVVAVVMTVVARKTRFGRYIFATGGNPDAAELSGINTRWLTVKVFALMGFLARPRRRWSRRPACQSHANDIGTLDELRVIAAAVIGGTALAGGVGTIYGAILGALIMQSLQSGHGHGGRGHAVPEHRRGRRAGARRLARHRLPQAHWESADGRRIDPHAGTPLVEMRDISHRLRRRPRRGPGHRRPLPRRGRGPARPQRRRQVDADQDACPAPTRPTAGEILIDGRPVDDPHARATPAPQSIETIYQTLALADNLDAASNLFLGPRAARRRFGLVDDARMEAETRKIMAPAQPQLPQVQRAGAARSRAGSGSRWRSPARSTSTPAS